ncbi:carbohydrate binding domain-containing protein, partial [Candidatus Izimaplasma bacterium]|nr:carbohydrate binding domain-containing protein [Candidatus Izimaplasma bacterium]
FNVGDTLPDFTSYFTSEGVVIDASMITHTLLLDANNIMTSAGVYSMTITIGSETKTVSLTVSDGSIDYGEIVEEGVAGIYVDPSQQTEFELGDYMPNFLAYFIAYDGANYVTITPDLVLHNLLLAADNRMIAAGTYQVSVELSIGGTVYTKVLDIVVNTLGGASVDSIGATGWEVQDSEFTNADLYDSWFIPSGDVTVTHDATAGEVDVHVNTVGMNFWDVIFAQPGKVFERGYTYEITYRMKTELSEGRDVVVFVEPSQGAAKLLEEQVSLTTVFQDFTFTFEASTDTTTGMAGVFIGANLPGAHPGSIVFDSITITRTGEPTVDVYLTDIPNQDFTNSDISEWGTEGNVVLSHDAAGYLVADVSAFTGNFWDENIQLGGFSVASGTTYTVTYTIKTGTTAGRDVTFFVEDTDAGYTKYFENTETLTTEFQTFTYTFTPTAYNQDTKIGIFVGDMENGGLGTIIIDSITVTSSN